MTEKADIPPKEEWKTWSVLIESGVAYRRVVRAPSKADAEELVERRLEADGLPYDSEEEYEGGYCEVDDAATEEAKDEPADLEWKPEGVR
ncbi:MAG TPA: hypothetical protein VMG99_08840 [Thermoplasmata archaeon]|nr:hypothetical protein [Thermoplasmata archaeon]